jgi:hypothetical protein
VLYTEYGNNELFIEKAKTRHLALQREAKIRNEEEIVHSFAVKKSFSDLTGVNAVVRHAGPAGPHIYDIYIGTPQAPLPAHRELPASRNLLAFTRRKKFHMELAVLKKWWKKNSRTKAIEKLENAGSYLSIWRPRRSGKSLFVASLFSITI